MRQLRNVLEHAALLGENAVIEATDLGTSLPTASSAAPTDSGDMSLTQAEARHIRIVLEREGWAVPRAAAVLGLSRSTLYERIRKHGIVLPAAESPSGPPEAVRPR